MKRIAPALLAVALLPALSGCLAKTAVGVVTAPVTSISVAPSGSQKSVTHVNCLFPRFAN
jgi:hypothetical protein